DPIDDHAIAGGLAHLRPRQLHRFRRDAVGLAERVHAIEKRGWKRVLAAAKKSNLHVVSFMPGLQTRLGSLLALVSSTSHWTTAFRSPVCLKTASWRPALVPSWTIWWTYPSAARLPSSSTTSSTNSSSSPARSRIGTSTRLPKSISRPSMP